MEGFNPPYKKNQKGEVIMNNKKDNIKPDHYGDSEIDVISFCQANNLDFMQGNVIKYITRNRKKNGLEVL